MNKSQNGRIVVTGASGFIGSRLCDVLESHGEEVVALTRKSELQKTSVALDLVEGSLHDNLLHGVRVIVHCAARAHVTREYSSEPMSEYRRMNVDATLKLASQAARSGVQRFIFLSSIGVNGNSTYSDFHPRSPLIFDESLTPSPHDMYAISKWEAELRLWELQRETGMEVVIIRPPLVYGPGAKGNFSTLLDWVSKGAPLPLKMVNNERSLLALDNLVSFIEQCINHPKAANELFVIADGEDVSTAELLRRVARANGKNARLVPFPVSLMFLMARILGKQSVADSLFGSLKIEPLKAKRLLGWKPVVTMDEQLRKCCDQVGRKS